MVADLTPTFRALSGESQQKVAAALDAYAMRAAEAGDQSMAQRLAYAKDQTYGGKRSMDAALGYKDTLTVADFRHRYERGGMAGRIVDAVPTYTWRGGFELIEDPDPSTETDFEKGWNELADRTGLLSVLLRGDKLSQIGWYAVIVIGAVDGELKAPLPPGTGPEQILHFSTYLGAESPSQGPRRTLSQAINTLGQEGDVSIKEWDTNPKSERFGKPSLYEIRRNADFARAIGAPTQPGNLEVHWSRVIHIADRCLDDDVFGKPVLERVWDLLDDLKKVSGGGAEAFLQAAKPTRLWSIDKELAGLDDTEKAALREQLELLQNGMTSDVRMRGVTATNLNASPAQFGANADEIRTQIAGSLGIPKRIISGSEQGELASTQDRDNLRDLVNGRRKEHAGPSIVRRLADRLVKFGYLPAPATYEVRWGAALNLTNEEKISGTSAWVAAKTEQGQIFSEDEIRDHWWEMEPLSEEERGKMQEIAAQKQADALALAQAKSKGQPQFGEGLRAAYSPNQRRGDDGRWVEEEDSDLNLAEDPDSDENHLEIYDNQTGNKVGGADVTFLKDRVYISMIHVDKDKRGKGYGNRLLKGVVRLANDRGLTKISGESSTPEYRRVADKLLGKPQIIGDKDYIKNETEGVEVIHTIPAKFRIRAAELELAGLIEQAVAAGDLRLLGELLGMEVAE